MSATLSQRTASSSVAIVSPRRPQLDILPKTDSSNRRRRWDSGSDSDKDSLYFSPSNACKSEDSASATPLTNSYYPLERSRRRRREVGEILLKLDRSIGSDKYGASSALVLHSGRESRRIFNLHKHNQETWLSSAASLIRTLVPLRGRQLHHFHYYYAMLAL